MTARLVLIAALFAVAGGSISGAQSPKVQTFDQMAVGGLPVGFTTASLRQTQPGSWVIANVGSTHALHHPSVPDADGWSLALAPADSIGNLRLTARVRLAAGSHTGGLVWHYQDARNFMAVLLDLDDGDLELFRVSDGNRIRLEDRDGLELDPQAWHTMRVVHHDGRTTVSIGGIRVLDWNERRATSRPGRVGMVAHGRSDAAFDDLRIEYANSSR
jgi:hypothetical protein